MLVKQHIRSPNSLNTCSITLFGQRLMNISLRASTGFRPHLLINVIQANAQSHQQK